MSRMKRTRWEVSLMLFKNDTHPGFEQALPGIRTFAALQADSFLSKPFIHDAVCGLHRHYNFKLCKSRYIRKD